MRAWVATSTARRAMRGSRGALGEIEVGLGGELGVAALQRDLAQQEFVQRRLAQVGGGDALLGLRGRRQRGPREGRSERRPEDDAGEGFGHLGSTHLRYIWCPAQAHHSAMPELPEVEVTRRGLAPQLAGRVICRRRGARAAPALADADATCARWPAAPCARCVGAASTCWSIAATATSSCTSACRAACACCRRARRPASTTISTSLFGDRMLRLRDPRRFGAVLWAPGDAAERIRCSRTSASSRCRATLDARAPARAHARPPHRDQACS